MTGADKKPPIGPPPSPFLRHCGIEREILAPGFSRATVTIEPHLANGGDTAHGGLLMTLIDSAMASAARSTLAEDHGVMTLDMQIAFLSPGRGRLTAEGRLVRGGKSLIFCEADVRDEAGDLVARASGLFRPRRPRKAAT